MRILLLLLFTFTLSCSNSEDVALRQDNKKDVTESVTTLPETGQDINNRNPDMIRKQTETSFRSVKSKDDQKYDPPALSEPGYNETDKK